MQDERDDPFPERGEGGKSHRTGSPTLILRARRLRKAMTPQEVKLWVWLREGFAAQGYHFRRQAPILRYIVDFACLRHRLIIEIDGGQHGSDMGRAADIARDAALAGAGYRVLRFWNHQIDREKRLVLDTIDAALREGLD